LQSSVHNFRVALFQANKSGGSLPLAVLPAAQGLRRITPPSLLTNGKLPFHSAKGQGGSKQTLHSSPQSSDDLRDISALLLAAAEGRNLRLL